VHDHADDLEGWLKEHEDHLGRLVEETRLGSDVIQLIALLILTEHTDEEIYDDLTAHTVSVNSGHNPLRMVPQAIERIRRLTGEA
jgi:hypothetical protein